MSDRFQRSRLPVLPTVLFADGSEDYRGMARDALLEGRANVAFADIQRVESRLLATSTGGQSPLAWCGDCGAPFFDGDDFHSPVDIARMRAGVPLGDAERMPWLQSIGRSIARLA